MQGKNAYHISIDKVVIVLLKSLSDSHVLNMFDVFVHDFTGHDYLSKYCLSMTNY